MTWLYLHFPTLAETASEGSLRRLALRAQQRVAHVALQAPAGLLLETGSMWRLESPKQLQHQLCHELQALDIPVQASQGPSPLAACLLAEAGGQPADCSADELKNALQALPVQACGLEAAACESLLRVGIRRCGEVLDLPTQSLGRRFGTSILQWRERLLGHLLAPQNWFTPPECFAETLDLNEDIEHLQGLRFPLARLLDALEAWCRQTQQATDELALRLHHRDRPPTDLILGSAVPEIRAEAWTELARLHLERITLYEPVTAISLRCRRTQALDVSHDDLTRGNDTRARQPAQLLSRLQARLGRAALLQPACKADYRPEHRNLWCQPEGARTPTPSDPATGSLAQQHPLWLLPQPKPVRRQRLRLLAGPERIQTGWWDLRGIKRDYYKARLPDRSLSWVFERPDGQWFIAGYFG